MLETIIGILKDTTIDSLKILPFLFLSYLLVEYIEHKSSDKIEKVLSKSGKYSKFLGAFLGILPQCGFSTVAATLFSNRVITIGTLISVFIATSDEMIPIFISYPKRSKELIIILIIKLIIAIISGTIVDLIFKHKKENSTNSKDDETHEMYEHIHENCKNCDCEHGILKSSIKHTINIFVFLYIISFAINLFVQLIGIDTFRKIIFSGSILQPFIASIIGLIPNCAASVLLTKLYLDSSISLGSIIAGLSTGAGVGGIVLFKTNKNIKENIKIVSLVYIIGVISGIIIDLVMRLM